MNDCENSLKEAMRLLAEAGPRTAPERVEIALQAAFRGHHRARVLRRMVLGAIAAGAAAAGILFMVRVPGPVGPPTVTAVHPAPPAIVVAAAAAKKEAPVVTVRPVHKPTHKPRTDQLAATEFVRLPYGDDALVDESATIVRVEMPRSALRLAGFMVAQERANERIQADVVLGADGLAHAVRFVQ